MRRIAGIILGFVGLVAQACSSDGPTATPHIGSQLVRVVNANTASIDVLVDGSPYASGVAPGAVVEPPAPTVGMHTIALREVGASTTTSLQLKVATNTSRTIAAIRTGATLSVQLLDDTNAVVQPGKTKVRVLHLAPNAGEITVMRTQPDYGTPITWQFPFVYSSTISPEGNPYYESTTGTWDIRAWRKPSEDALGWSATSARVTLDVASGDKRTVLVLDKAGGGIRLQVIE